MFNTSASRGEVSSFRPEFGFVQLNKIDCQYTKREIRGGVEAAKTLAKEMASACRAYFEAKGAAPKSDEIAYRREFKCAMRERIKDVAASRGLSVDDIKPAMTLKHHEIARFTEQHGVNVEWLLEGAQAKA